MGSEITKAQTTDAAYAIAMGLGPSALSMSETITYAQFRTLRRHPTIKLARALAMAPIEAASWVVEADEGVPPERVAFVEEQALPIRPQFMRSMLTGTIDYGWAAFEKVFKYDDSSGLMVWQKIKALLNDITAIQVFEGTGAFAGFKQGMLEVPLDNSFLVSAEVEGSNWYGESRLKAAKGPYDKWVKADAAAEHYDERIAGASHIVKYPPGTTVVDGETVNNHDLAKEVLAALMTTGGIVLPQITLEYLSSAGSASQDRLNWEIDILSDGGPKQYSFIPRLNYLDAQMTRAMLIPERMMMEGRFGNKAEAGVHADLAITCMDLTHQDLTRAVNWYCVDQLLALNWGNDARGTVRLIAAPLVDAQLVWLREVYAAILSNPQGLLQEYASLDVDSLREQLRLTTQVDDETDDLVKRTAAIATGLDDVDMDSVVSEAVGVPDA